ncbi:hypothetical protein LJR219_001314 [Phenylobacterium sp. LjRoot219]|uniref:hypothetical protein n=1 Tax=Phenylobacterium sp. LjRoot219 TaxID=3342283 RepID=UPI003ECE6A79
MGSAVEKLTRLVEAPERFDIPWDDLRPVQIAAMNERFQQRKDAIKLLAHRATEGGVSEVRDLAEVVPLLFAHTAYKSYPENWLGEQKWDRMGRWLSTVSTYPVKDIDLAGVTDIDDWIDRLGRAGHHVSCSSGTTGKSAMLNASDADMAWSRRDTVAAFTWGAGVEPRQDRKMFGLAPVASVPKNLEIRDALRAAFADPTATPFLYPVPPITIGKLTGMVALRKAIADGTAKPGDLAAYEATAAERQQAVDAAVGISAEALVAARKDKLFLSGMWASLYRIAEAVRALGYGAKDFQPDNTIYIGGGLKGAVLPPNYREYVFETFNLSPERIFQMYGMQEINTAMPRCTAGRYHVAPWLICLPLDEAGETLLPIGKGEVEGRAAFFDASLDGRWGGVISGDKIAVDFGQCACGHQGPSIRDNIARYAELPGGDKISCAGTIDAYVRGVA